MGKSETFNVYRARPSDAQAIAEFVTAATRGRVSIDNASVVERFSTKGLWLVRDADDKIVGLSGWRAENLVARIDDFLVFPPELLPSAGKALMDNIEEAARELQCEASMFFVPQHISPRTLEFYQSCGYERPQLDVLPRVWQETVREAEGQNRYALLKKLREDLVLRPM
jgi:N-acetylglutamate synthase-like GNAT family acetyltransferase